MYIVQQWLLVLSLAFTVPVSSSPTATNNSNLLNPTNMNRIEMTQKIANLSAGGIPSDFKLQLLMGPHRPFHLPNKAYFYSAIRALELLALEDWDGVTGKRDFETTKYPDLRILTNTRYETIPRKYVIWALFLSCGVMKEVYGFGSVFFEMKWQEREVGGIAFDLMRKPPRPHLLSGDFSNTTEVTEQSRVVSSDHRNVTYSSALSDVSTSQTGLTVPSNAGIVSAIFIQHGGYLHETNIYMMILMALVDAAKEPNQHRIDRLWRSSFDDYHTELYTIQEPPSRSQRPYYTFGVLIRSLALYAEYFVTENKFLETGMMTMVDEVPVATTLLRRERTASDQNEVSTA